MYIYLGLRLGLALGFGGRVMASVRARCTHLVLFVIEDMSEPRK